MMPHEINQAIAEHLGWTGIRQTVTYRLMGWMPYSPEYDDSQWHAVPDYYNDLNAMHNVEKTLAFEQCQEYSEMLVVMTDDCEYHASAAQKAEAYLHVKRLWVEGGAK